MSTGRSLRTSARRLATQPVAVVSFVAVVLAGALSYRHGKDVNFDQLNSHISFAIDAFDGRLARRPPVAGGYGGFLPFYWDLPWWVLAVRTPDYVAMLALVALAIPAIIGTARLGRTVLGELGPWGGPVAGLALGLSSVSARTELGTTFGNLVTAGLLLIGISLLLDHVRQGSEVPLRAQRWAGALFGLSVGLKWTNAVFVAAVLVALLSVHLALRIVVRIGLWSGAVLAITSAPWAISSWSAYRNPVYPFYNGVFGSRFYDATSGADDRWPMSVREVITLPYRLAMGTSATSELPVRDPRLLVTVFAVVLVGVQLLRRRRASAPGAMDPVFRFLTVTVLLSLPLWGVLFGVQRYFIVGEVLAGLLIGRVLIRLLGLVGVAEPAEHERVRSATFGAFATAAIVAVAISASAKAADFGHLPFSGHRWVEVLQFDRPSTDLIVFDDDRIAYTALFFDGDTPMANLSPVYRPHFQMTPVFAERLRRASQPIVVFRDTRQGDVAGALARFGGSLDTSACGVLRTNIDVLQWCRITKAATG